MTTYQQQLAGTTYHFDGIVDLPAKATPLRSGDELSGCAAGSDAERAAAQWVLGLRPAPEFEMWLQSLGMADGTGRVLPVDAAMSSLRQLTAA